LEEKKASMTGETSRRNSTSLKVEKQVGPAGGGRKGGREGVRESGGE